MSCMVSQINFCNSHFVFTRFLTNMKNIDHWIENYESGFLSAMSLGRTALPMYSFKRIPPKKIIPKNPPKIPPKIPLKKSPQKILPNSPKKISPIIAPKKFLQKNHPGKWENSQKISKKNP